MPENNFILYETPPFISKSEQHSDFSSILCIHFANATVFWEQHWLQLFNHGERKLHSIWINKLDLNNKLNKLGLSCAKLRIVELKIDENKILGLNENNIII